MLNGNKLNSVDINDKAHDKSFTDLQSLQKVLEKGKIRVEVVEGEGLRLSDYRIPQNKEEFFDDMDVQRRNVMKETINTLQSDDKLKGVHIVTGSDNNVQVLTENVAEGTVADLQVRKSLDNAQKIVDDPHWDELNEEDWEQYLNLEDQVVSGTESKPRSTDTIAKKLEATINKDVLIGKSFIAQNVPTKDDPSQVGQEEVKSTILHDADENRLTVPPKKMLMRKNPDTGLWQRIDESRSDFGTYKVDMNSRQILDRMPCLSQYLANPTQWRETFTPNNLIKMLNKGQQQATNHFECLAAHADSRGKKLKMKASISATLNLKQKLIEKRFNEWGIPDAAKSEFIEWNTQTLRSMHDSLCQPGYKYLDTRLETVRKDANVVEEVEGEVSRVKKQKIDLVPQYELRSASQQKIFKTKKSTSRRSLQAVSFGGEEDVLEETDKPWQAEPE